MDFKFTTKTGHEITVEGFISVLNFMGDYRILNHSVNYTPELAVAVEQHNLNLLRNMVPHLVLDQKPWHAEFCENLPEPVVSNRPPADPFADWSVKPGMWVEADGRIVKTIDDTTNGRPWVKMGTSSEHGGQFNKISIEQALREKRLRILTPAEVEAHERKLKYPVLAPGDVVERKSELWYVVPTSDNAEGIIMLERHLHKLKFFTQEECRAKIKSGEWVKYVREVKP